MTSTSSPRRRLWKHDVFLSFRGKDTRQSFVCHLHKAFCIRGIDTFMDSPGLSKGDDLSELLTAIEESRIAIVVLSANFVTSSWCLDEVVKIMQCKKKMGQIVIPVFYEVDPSDARHQTRSFQLRRKLKVEVMEHEEVYGENEDKLKEWAAALTELANLSGWHSLNYEDYAELIESIVGDGLKKLIPGASSSVDKGFVGMDSRIGDLVHNYICPQFGGVRIIGIHGMRGIGATMIKRRLCKKKVLVVIDDVDHPNQLEKLAGSPDWFGPGSRIVVTTPDIHLLKAHDVDVDVDARYKATGLNDPEAIQLLSLKAFKESVPPEDHSELCNLILRYAQGLPLAVVVLGSFLKGRSIREWKSVIDRLNNTPHPEIIDVLRISFDGLQEKDKHIFLHIACFYKGWDMDRVTQILDYCKLEPDIGLSDLADKSLITISDNKLSMHDLLQELGWEIVR